MFTLITTLDLQRCHGGLSCQIDVRLLDEELGLDSFAHFYQVSMLVCDSLTTTLGCAKVDAIPAGLVLREKLHICCALVIGEMCDRVDVSFRYYHQVLACA